MKLGETLRSGMQSLVQSRWAMLTAAVGVVIIALVAAAWMGWLHAVGASRWLWPSVLILLALGIFAAIRWGIPWVRERRFVRTEGSEYVVAGQQSPEEFRAKFSKALQALKTLPRLKGKGDPVYALPWFLLLGEGGGGKTAAVEASGLFSSLLPAAKDGGTQNFDWWVSTSAVVIDTAGRYAIPVDAARDRSEWYRFLRLLRHHRMREPINGLVIAVPADRLSSETDEALRATGTKLRERIEEAVRELGVDAPIYVLVTCCDRLEGFHEYITALPERMSNEALGFVDDGSGTGAEQGGRGAAALPRLRAGLQAIYERLHFFRLTLLEGKIPDAHRPAVFCFPEEFRSLERSLATFIEALCTEDVRYHTPLFRGVFFTSAMQGDARISFLRRDLNLGSSPPAEGATAKHYFLNDVFERMLPRDGSLATTTARERRRRGAGAVLRRGGTAALCAVLALLVGHAYITDRHLAASVNEQACPEKAGSDGAVRLELVDQCREIVQALHEGNERRPAWSRWVADRSGHTERVLRERYVQLFHNAALAPLNRGIDQAFESKADPLPLMLLLAHRIQVSRCALSPSGCAESAADELQPDYPLMLTAAGGRAAPPEALSRLKRDYAAYLFWQAEPRQTLRQDVADDEKRLRQWLSGKRFSLDTLLALVNKRSPPLTADAYWELPAPIGAGAARVEAACRKEVWEKEVAPFLQQLQDAVPDAAAQLRDFQQSYRTGCLTQWQQFLAHFADGAKRWKSTDQRRAMTLRLLSAQSPVIRVIDDSVADLAPWVAGADGSAPPQWLAELNGYAGSSQRKSYQDALAKLRAQLEQGNFTTVCFTLAKDAFAEGKPSAESVNPVLHASWLASQAGAVAQQTEPSVLQPLLSEPVRYVWRTLLDGAAADLQKLWAETVIVPLKGLPAADQVMALYGPGGKVASFADQALRPFLAGEPPRPATLLDERLPVSQEFVQVLVKAKDFQPILDAGAAAQAVGIAAAGASDIEARSHVRGEQTLFAVTCGGKAYRITNRPLSPDEATTTVPWTSQGCADMTITTYFFPGEAEAPEGAAGAKRFQLTKTYGGRSGFLQFLQDFTPGAHRFVLDELTGDPDALRSGATAITVHCRLQIPAALSGLVTALPHAAPPSEIASVSS